MLIGAATRWRARFGSLGLAFRHLHRPPKEVLLDGKPLEQMYSMYGVLRHHPFRGHSLAYKQRPRSGTVTAYRNSTLTVIVTAYRNSTVTAHTVTAHRHSTLSPDTRYVMHTTEACPRSSGADWYV